MVKKGAEGRSPAEPGYAIFLVVSLLDVRGGVGLGFCIYNILSSGKLTHLKAPLVEQMWLSLLLNDIKTAYRPPWLNMKTFLDALAVTTDAFSWCDNLVILGDININMYRGSDNSSKN